MSASRAPADSCPSCGVDLPLNARFCPACGTTLDDAVNSTVRAELPPDETGPVPDDLARALRAGVAAFILTPRAQNPTGAALDAARVRELRRVLGRHPDVLVVEDDHAGPVAGAPGLSVWKRKYALELASTASACVLSWKSRMS